ncbi:MAG: 3-oxoacyl-[acyl-carrier-protein] synthase III C-terminal domain-containing protein, partial [bacterium]
GCGEAMGGISLVVPHQSNVRIIEEAARLTGLPVEKFYVNMGRRGNTSAASVPLAFAEALGEGRIRGGDRVVLASYGAGLAWASCLVEWGDG